MQQHIENISKKIKNRLMQIVFKDKYLEDLYEGRPVKGKPKYSEDVLDKFAFKVQLKIYYYE